MNQCRRGILLIFGIQAVLIILHFGGLHMTKTKIWNFVAFFIIGILIGAIFDIGIAEAQTQNSEDGDCDCYEDGGGTFFSKMECTYMRNSD